MLNRWQASRCQQAFSKHCLVNLISKDTHLVFSIYSVSVQIICDDSTGCDKMGDYFDTGTSTMKDIVFEVDLNVDWF